ncbi:hypothetical protein [Desulforamulus putei]|uniref:Uncharacterized protein n=1 Tax=Desulforamulus putei DSM 12395 TaxID=1121429 RepID=A0A1M4ZX21_9FIRM|nr:hypothetical protein [Desulforamulus putei]SHF22166.1 hypothetical protein SAMN02745133_02099 [Desulforamulus putei DSM 12395]
MSSLSYPERTEARVAGNKLLDQLINRLENGAGIKISTEYKGVLERTVTAGDFCAAYPHLNRDVVMASMLLFPLVKEGRLPAGLQGVMEVLEDMDIEEKFNILNVLVAAQTDFARGEAKIVQYFCHS